MLRAMTEKLRDIKDSFISIKTGTITAILLSVIGTAGVAGVGWEKIQARLRHLDGKTDLYAERFDALEKRVDSNDIKFAEIQKDLSSIESILLEIKQKIK
jgi:hypothetical protein